MARVHCIISGDVQGVGFRAWVLRFARSRKLSGWVKNREDGAVELIAEGPKGELEELVKRCHRGPDVAWVEHVDVQWESSTEGFVSFEVIY